ncbi:MAG TPA: nuclear transport factor 2 family protein [Hanamia sp.]|nr:nuclear transport factor 2 family protein [Hanamia sp.]
MKYFCLLICLAFCNGMKAQSADDSVRSAVNQLFTAMKNADSALLVSGFADSAILQTVIDKNGKVQIKTESIPDFAREVAKMQKGILDERIQFDVIRIDGALAIVWAPYQFYYKGKFSHCSADSFQLIRINGKWKIQYLIDTRRSHGCQ